MKHVLSTVSALALLPLAAQADTALELAPLTFYASELPLELGRSGTSVSVLTEDEIARAPETTLADRLDALPGLSVSGNGGPGQSTQLRIRGLPTQYAPVYINGIEATDASADKTSFNFGNILAGGITRAEVVKGSQSALYGSDAIAGIIALDLAKAPETPGQEGRAAAEVGAYGTKSATLGYGVAGETWGLALSASRFVTDGFSSIEAPGFKEDDAYRATQIGLDAYWDVTPDLRFGLSGFDYSAEGDYDANEWPNVEDGSFTNDSWGLRAYAQLQTGAVAHELSLSRFDVDRSFDAGGYHDSFGSTRDTAAYSGTWTIAEGRSLSFGLDRTTEEANFTSPVNDIFWNRIGTIYSDEEIDNTGIFTELAWAFAPTVDAVFSLRHDEHSEFGGAWSGRAALSWRATEALTLRGALAQGYRAPSLYELFSPAYGNTRLDPETSFSAEIGADYAFAGGATLGATLFYTEIDDLIDFDFATSRYTQVPGTTVSKGLELAGTLPVGERVSLTGGFTYTDARDASDNPLQKVPRYDLSLGVDAEITDRLTGGLSISHKADFPGTWGIATFQTVEDYTVVNAQISYEVRDGVEAYLRVENLFDEEYQVIPDYATSDRAAYFGIRARF
ncbi:TonB-dependent receptor [Salipiger sp. P9]|uniref:TonB-dependent receptor plug domain-containing protein n=1 Tax=Salipiger pentaromativorans TaxID=2943193 RepID=UPI00215837F5|nr:TonB-dependent receptor [Salipiger pentaromativorans]MCR8546504.1 TonB-dependent receptor [Salipiger pentaromativorans]